MGTINITTDLQIVLNSSRWKHQQPKHSILMHHLCILRLPHNILFWIKVVQHNLLKWNTNIYTWNAIGMILESR